MAVTISGMFGDGKTYFSDSPVVIDISGLEWPASTPFSVVLLEVLYNGVAAGKFKVDTNKQSNISFDISSALRAIWSGYTFSPEVAAANAAAASTGEGVFIPTGSMDILQGTRKYREYSIAVHTEYIASDGVFTRTDSGVFSGGRCSAGGLTEWERSTVADKRDADMSHWNGTNPRFGDASTKPTESPERVGRDSITSWVDFDQNGTRCVFYSSSYGAAEDTTSQHAPLVLRDSIPYTDFVFVNRRGAVETCSGLTLEAMNIEVDTRQYGLVERPSFKPSRSLMAIAKGGRRSWAMSSGHQTREWAEWWTLEFLKARRVWMLYKGVYVPVIVEPAKKQTGIYDRAKQQMPTVEFTVTMALEG